MATLSEARGVKSLNTGPGRQRFKHKKLSQRFEEIDVDVFRNYTNSIKDEPSEGSTFFRDCLIEWRELNTAEDFISLYQETFPLVQTLPQIIVQKEEILSKLLTRLEMKSRLSLEPILRCIAALSRDLLEDFLPYLHQIVNSLVSLLKSGADREPEIVEQIFTSWSSVMMFLHRYLRKDVVHILNATVKLRYYPHDDVQRLMAASIAFILRNAPVEQVIKGIRRIMIEVVNKPSAMRKYGATELLLHVMRGTSSTLHSRASEVLRLLLKRSFYGSGDELLKDYEPVIEVLCSTFETLSNNLGPVALRMLWDCLYGEIVESVSNGYTLHLSRLVSLLVCIVRNGYMKKVMDYRPICELVSLQLQTYVTHGSKGGDPALNALVNGVFQLLLAIIDNIRRDALSELSCQCTPLFSLRTTSLMIFLRDLVLRDSDILKVFRINIISALNDLVDLSEEETLYLLLRFIENLQMPSSSFLDGTPKERMSKICDFVRAAINNWIGIIRGSLGRDYSSMEFADNRFALLWGAVKCYPYVSMEQANASLLLDFINALDELLIVESDSSINRNNWQSLIGAALGSWKEMICSNGVVGEESTISKLLDLSKRHCSCSQILGPIADIFDAIIRMGNHVGSSHRRYHCEFQRSKTIDALNLYADNLCHFDPSLRHATLRILCHYEPLNLEFSPKGQSNSNNNGDVLSETFDVHDPVLEHLLSVEASDLSTTSRKGELLLSRIQMNVSSKRINENYVPALLYGMIGIFHKQFRKFWEPAMECLSLLISKHFHIAWDRYIRYMDHCESMFLTSHDDSGRCGSDGINSSSDLVEYFKSSIRPQSGNLQCATVLSLLIKSLQRVPSLVESHSDRLVPLFLEFLGYRVKDLTSLEFCKLQCSKRKEWKEALKEWLNLFKLIRNPKSLYCSHFLKNILEYRLLDETDAEVQSNVLDCLLNWKDEYIVPYRQHLKDLINAKNLREELTTWSLSRGSNQIDYKHRNFLVPVILRILVPKVRKLKGLAARKHASVQQRRAILGFLAELDVDELPLFFALLINPLQTTSDGADSTQKCHFMPPESIRDQLGSLSKEFTVDGVKLISWRKRFGFLHVVEEVLSVFDKSRVNPFLDLLMGCVVRILESCPATEPKDLSQIHSDFNDHASEDTDAENNKTRNTDVKQFKALRSLCLKIISSALVKFEYHDFGPDFWNHFFIALRPLIAHFKQVGASSEKPSSLFSCFLAMSRSFKLVSILTWEKNLVPDIFSMLEVKTASNAIISSVFMFVENLLNLALELRTEGNSVEEVLHPHLHVLVSSLHKLFTSGNGKKRKLAAIELRVLELLSRYIKESLEAKMFLDILLPHLEKKFRNSDSYVSILKIIQHVTTIIGSEDSPRILNSVSPLLTFAELEVRKSICDVLGALAEVDSDVLHVAKLLTELNAISTIEMDSLDYDMIIRAYEKIDREFFCTVSRHQALIVLSHSVYDMSSQELILRQSAYRLLLCFVEFSVEILEEKIKSDQGWTKERIENNIKNFLLKHMGNAMNKETSTQKVWIDLLREMVLKLPEATKLKSCIALHHSKNPEQDFFSNIIHLQKHRRARALSAFTIANSSGNLPEDITKKVFLPLFLNLLLGVQEGKGENVRSASMKAIASIAGSMSWKEYYKLLMNCFRELSAKREKQKVLLRLISCILDNFHFSTTCMISETEDTVEDSVGESSEKRSSGVELGRESAIQTCIHKIMLPKVQKLLISDPNKVNVTVCLVALKLLKLLPSEFMELHLRSIIHRISNFLTNRLESVRDEARSALAASLKELGLEHLQFMVKVLRGTLKRGFELHVLGYTLHFLLSKFIANSESVKLDHCLGDLLAIIENDIHGDVSEEKEVDKIASKMKETRKQKSYETLGLIAQNVTFNLHIKNLLSVVTVHLQKPLTPKLKSKLEKMLNHIAAGIESNPSADSKQLFTFVHYELEKAIGSNGVKQDGGAGDSGSRHSHLMTVFYLGLLQNRIKSKKLDRSDIEQLSMLDPFISLLSDCLSSKYETVVSTSLICLSSLVTLRLPALRSEADKIKLSLLLIAQGSWNAGNPLMESCLRLLTVLIRRPYVSFSDDQLQMLLQFPVFVDFEKNPSFLCLSLLEAIVRKKLKFSEIYKFVKRVAEVMVTCEVELIRKKCSEILLLFLSGYGISAKLLQEYLDFFLTNLRYKHSSGREAALEMIHTVMATFDIKKLDEKSESIFFHLVVSLANDNDYKVRSMTGAAIKLLIGKVSSTSLESIIDFSLSWYMADKQDLWSAAAQVLGLLVEVIGQRFQKYISNVLPVLRRIMKTSVGFLVNGQLDVSNRSPVPLWKEAYYSLVLLEKILHKFQALSYEKDLQDMWEMICEFLLHPHSWLRNISNRLVALCLKNIAEAVKETHSLTRPSRLFFIAASLCCQLRTQTDDSARTLIASNLDFVIRYLHLLLGQSGHVDFSEFWSNLEDIDQSYFARAFHVLDPRKGKSTLAYLTSNISEPHGEENKKHSEHILFSYLLKKMGKISLQMETVQAKIVFNSFKSISSALLGQYRNATLIFDDEHYAYQILLPLYKVCEGYAGRVVSDDVKQLAQEVRESIQKDMGIENFVQVYNQIRKNLKAKRDKRKREEKLLAVVNPMRNAKRKLRIAAKHRAYKKRKIMSVKIGRWV